MKKILFLFPLLFFPFTKPVINKKHTLSRCYFKTIKSCIENNQINEALLLLEPENVHNYILSKADFFKKILRYASRHKCQVVIEKLAELDQELLQTNYLSQCTCSAIDNTTTKSCLYITSGDIEDIEIIPLQKIIPGFELQTEDKQLL